MVQWRPRRGSLTHVAASRSVVKSGKFNAEIAEREAVNPPP